MLPEDASPTDALTLPRIGGGGLYKRGGGGPSRIAAAALFGLPTPVCARAAAFVPRPLRRSLCRTGSDGGPERCDLDALPHPARHLGVGAQPFVQFRAPSEPGDAGGPATPPGTKSK